MRYIFKTFILVTGQSERPAGGVRGQPEGLGARQRYAGPARWSGGSSLANWEGTEKKALISFLCGTIGHRP